MIVKVLTGLRVAAAWHRLLLRNSPTYREACQLLGTFIARGYWDLEDIDRHGIDEY